MILNKKLVIKLAKKNELKKIQNFLKLNYKKKHILSQNTKIFKWYYFKKKINCTLAFIKKKIVGIYLFIPLSHFDVKLYDHKQIFGSLWSIKGFNRLTNKNNNNNSGAIALKFFNKTYEILKPKLIISVGLDNKLLNFHKVKRYNVLKLNHHFLASPYIKKFKILKNITKLKFKHNKKIDNKINIKKIEDVNEIKNLNIKNLFKEQLPFKSKIYLINRYLKDPSYKYHIYIISKQKIICLCVFRIIKFKKINIIRIVDYVGKNNTFKNLNTFFLNILKVHKAEYLDFYNYGIPLSILRQAGLSNKIDFNDIIIPNYFEPFVDKNIDIICAYKKLGAIGNVRIFKGDSDQDRSSLLK
jgi:hypothetical protein